jgi:hypothetical protein
MTDCLIFIDRLRPVTGGSEPSSSTLSASKDHPAGEEATTGK